MKRCKYCNIILSKKNNEDNWRFNQKKYCNKKCYWNHKKIIMKGHITSQETRQKISRILKGRKMTEEQKQRIKNIAKKQWQNLEYRYKQIMAHRGKIGEKASHWKGGINNSETKYYRNKNTSRKKWNKKISIALKNRFKDKTKHPNWKGGLSLLPYCIRFTKELKDNIRKRDKYTCQECNYTEKQLGYTLIIHHIDYNKLNSIASNLISLCRSCHIKTNYNRENWKNYYQNKINI